MTMTIIMKIIEILKRTRIEIVKTVKLNHRSSCNGNSNSNDNDKNNNKIK